MTTLTSVNRATRSLPIQTGKISPKVVVLKISKNSYADKIHKGLTELKNATISSNLYKGLIELRNPTISSAIWGGLSIVGETARSFCGGSNVYYSDARNQRELYLKQLLTSLNDPHGSYELLNRRENINQRESMKPEGSLQHMKIAAEFMMASHLTFMALKSLGVKPSTSAKVSLVAGFAITTLIQCGPNLVGGYKEGIISDTFFKTVSTPLFGA
ncbi:MAG TPA: hypothetical protein VGP47_05095, partial [Parachlamydiaceae bacterium]|nr:hypothetical protein [Parachlamydiaceae bacterium]